MTGATVVSDPAGDAPELRQLLATLLGDSTVEPLAHRLLDPSVTERSSCVLLVDGLGAGQLREHADLAPFLSAAWRNGGSPDAQLAVGFPSTTACSLASLATGLGSGEHGLLGYTMAVPDQRGSGDDYADPGPLLALLRWHDDPDPALLQPRPTLFERAAASRRATSVVAPAAFEHTGLTRAIFRGARFMGADSVDARRDAVRASVAPRSVTYCYWGDLDHTGHRWGVDSEQWRHELGRADDFARALRDELPADVTLVVTADHGMLDVDPAVRIDIDALPQLRAGVRLLGGEPRARYVYTEPGAAQDVAEVWRAVLGDGAEVLLRDEAVEAGWFGDVVAVEHLGRIGDVVVAAHGRTTMVQGTQAPHELALVGFHGSLTATEQHVPLIVV